jgi:hypothetical protein
VEFSFIRSTMSIEGWSQVPGQPRKEKFQDPIFIEKKVGVVMHACHSSYGKKPNIGGSWARLAWQKVRP